MDFSRIEKLLKPGIGVDLQALYAQFGASGGAGGLDLFMLYLHEHGYLEPSTLIWVADAEAVSAEKINREDHSIVPGDANSGEHMKGAQRAVA